MAQPFYNDTKYFKGQRALTTGQNLTPTELEAYMSTEYSLKANREERARAYTLQKEIMDTQKEQFAIQTQTQREAAEGQERAATVAGVGTAISSTAQAALLYKLYGGGAKDIGIAGVSKGATPIYAADGVTVIGQRGVSGEFIPLGQSVPEAIPWYNTPIAGTSATPVAVGGVAIAGYGGAKIGQSKEVKSAMPGGEKEKKYVGSILGGAAAGAAVGAAFGGVGAVPGAIIGGIVGVADVAAQETIICTELHRQGYLTDRDLFFDRIYGIILNKRVHKGYLILAKPIVEKMIKSKKFTKFIAIFGTAFAREVGHKFSPKEYKSSLLGKAIIFFGKPLCRIIYALGGK